MALLVGDRVQAKIKLWHGNESQQDISLPECDTSIVTKCEVGMFIESPHIVLNVRTHRRSLIKVYKIEATVLHQVKSIRVEGVYRLRPIANKFCLGLLAQVLGPPDSATTVHLFTKKELFAAGLSPDETERRRIEVEGNIVAMNTTSLISVLEDKERMGLIKNYFWV